MAVLVTESGVGQPINALTGVISVRVHSLVATEGKGEKQNDGKMPHADARKTSLGSREIHCRFLSHDPITGVPLFAITPPSVGPCSIQVYLSGKPIGTPYTFVAEDDGVGGIVACIDSAGVGYVGRVLRLNVALSSSLDGSEIDSPREIRVQVKEPDDEVTIMYLIFTTSL